MEILYVSSVPSKNEFDNIKTKIKNGIDVTTYGMNESGFKFHTLIINGICGKKDINIYSLVGRSVSHKTHKGFFWKKKIEKPKSNLTIKHLGFLNFPILKQICLSVSFFFNTIAWIKRNKGNEKYIIMDASYVTVVPYVIFAAKLYKCKTTAIFCDIYEYMAQVKDARNNERVSLKHKSVRNIMEKLYKRLDSFVLLTEKMNSVVNSLNKPYIIIEGLVDILMENEENDISLKHENDIIMYAGSLRKQYGLYNLVEGFRKYKNDNARLWIFGGGDFSDDIRRATKIDSRIIFFGIQDIDIVVKKEFEANLLINPRPIDMEFTKYSFPSKNMEYMVSGTPILTTKLPGMPREYYEYIYTIDGNLPEDITIALEKTFNENSRQKLHKKGAEAKEFVLKNKNNILQSEKIINLLRR